MRGAGFLCMEKNFAFFGLNSVCFCHLLFLIHMYLNISSSYCFFFRFYSSASPLVKQILP